jgi:Mn-dependent DtxR family transcriptional regulator
MQEIRVLETKLTTLQENILIELNKTYNTAFICKKMGIKPITLSKSIQSLTKCDFITENTLTEKGKKMAHYLEFRNETILLFLNKHHLPKENDLIVKLSKLDYKLIIALRNSI